jgi:2-(1,2-epoxy-1,2-dihydrophenyl)acetyl-CoA isomerase
LSDNQDVTLERDGAVLIISLNRPESRNGLRPSTCEAIADAIESAQDNLEIRCIVLTGKGQSFCSGADLMSAVQDIQGRPHGEIIRTTFHRLIRSVAGAQQPVIASIRGAAVGFGFDLALACDLRIASRFSKFGSVFSRIGLVPDGGSSFTLSRLVGLGRAIEMMMLAETFDGERAAELGVVNKVVNDDELEAATKEWADRLAAGPPLAYALGKANIYKGSACSLDQALDNECEAQMQCLSSADAMEGVGAFLQKRKPTFRGS